MCSIGGFRGESLLSTWFWTLAQNEVARNLRAVAIQRDRFKSIETGGNDCTTMEIAAVPRNLDATIATRSFAFPLSKGQLKEKVMATQCTLVQIPTLPSSGLRRQVMILMMTLFSS